MNCSVIALKVRLVACVFCISEAVDVSRPKCTTLTTVLQWHQWHQWHLVLLIPNPGIEKPGPGLQSLSTAMAPMAPSILTPYTAMLVTINREAIV